MLLLKAARSIWANKQSYIACMFLIGIGIMMYLAMNSAGEGLGAAVEQYYYEHNMADVFAKVEAMPDSAVAGLADIEGIEDAEARYVLEARTEVGGADDIITLRLISQAADIQINTLVITENPLAAEADILLNPTFYAAHELSVGDAIAIFVEGREYTYNVSGTAMSPEYVYITRGGNEMLPDATGFGVAYITADSMARLANSAGIANDIVLTLQEGYTFDEVKIALEDALDPYGLEELISREDQLSYAFVDLEVQGIRSMASSLPLIFILMAAIVLYLMMKRVIEQDRTQIGTLKALGYSTAQVLAHYLSYGGITGLFGALLGSLGGFALAGFYFNMFMNFFIMPAMSFTPSYSYIFGGLLLSLSGGVGGAFFGTYKILRLKPAEAMRAEGPKPLKYDIVGRSKFLLYILTSRGSMAVRSIARNPMRSGFVALGIMFSYGLLTLCGSFNGLIDKMMFSQFEVIQVYEVKVQLRQPLAYDDAVESAYAIGHIERAEGLLEIPVQLKNRHLSAGAMLTGLERQSTLYKIADTVSGVSYPAPQDSLIITNSIAADLRVGAGDTVYISSPLLKEDTPLMVSRVVEQNMGSGCYLELGLLASLLNLPRVANSLILDTDDIHYLKEYLKGGQNVAAIEDKANTLQKTRAMMDMYTSIFYFMQLMSAAVAFAIIYNTATISLSERKREYATLRVVGLSIKEVCEIMNFEYWTLTALGMLLGLPFSGFLNTSMNAMMGDTGFTMPSVLPLSAYVSGVIGCVAVVFLSNLIAKRKIGKFDMVEVLKERE